MAHNCFIRLASAFGIACPERACTAAAGTVLTQMSDKLNMNAGFQPDASRQCEGVVCTCRSQLIALGT